MRYVLFKVHPGARDCHCEAVTILDLSVHLRGVTHIVSLRSIRVANNQCLLLISFDNITIK